MKGQQLALQKHEDTQGFYMFVEGMNFLSKKNGGSLEW